MRRILPLVALEAAGIPLDASFSEQRAILQRCEGIFYSCEAGGQASRLNRLLMDAGLNQGLIDGDVLSVLSVTLRGMFRLARSRISTPHGWLTDQLRLQRCVE